MKKYLLILRHVFLLIIPYYFTKKNFGENAASYIDIANNFMRKISSVFNNSKFKYFIKKILLKMIMTIGVKNFKKILLFLPTFLYIILARSILNRNLSNLLFQARSSNLYIDLENVKKNYKKPKRFDKIKDTNKPIKIDIIIPVHNALEYTALCLRSVFKYATNNDIIKTNVIIIDDYSDEHTSKYLDEQAKKFKNWKVIHNNKNLGFVRSCNKGMSESSADIIVLLNSDTIITTDFCEKIANCFLSDNKIGVASPLATASPNAAIPMLPGYNVFQMAELIDYLSERKYPEFVTCEGFCFCISKECINKIGLFDEIYCNGYGGEESDYSLLALKHGFRTVLIDDLYIYHKRHATFGKKKRDELYKGNKKIFMDRWADFYKEKYTEHMNPPPFNYINKKIKYIKKNLKNV